MQTSYVYNPQFFARQLAFFNISSDFEQINNSTYIFHGLHVLPGNVTDQVTSMEGEQPSSDLPWTASE